LEIDNYGNVNAGYSNGQNVALGKIIVANFANNSGLKQIGNSSFLATKASGDPEHHRPGHIVGQYQGQGTGDQTGDSVGLNVDGIAKAQLFIR